MNSGIRRIRRGTRREGRHVYDMQSTLMENRREVYSDPHHRSKELSNTDPLEILRRINFHDYKPDLKSQSDTQRSRGMSSQTNISLIN